MREFNPFNQILLTLFYILNAFHDSFLANIEAKMDQTVTTQMLSWNAFEMSNKLNNIWLNGLNSRISKVEGLNSRISKIEELIPIFTKS